MLRLLNSSFAYHHGVLRDDLESRSALWRYLARLELEGGQRAVQRFAEQADTSTEYLEHVARGYKRPGADLSSRLVRAAAGELSYADLIESRAAA